MKYLIVVGIAFASNDLSCLESWVKSELSAEVHITNLSILYQLLFGFDAIVNEAYL